MNCRKTSGDHLLDFEELLEGRFSSASVKNTVNDESWYFTKDKVESIGKFLFEQIQHNIHLKFPL